MFQKRPCPLCGDPGAGSWTRSPPRSALLTAGPWSSASPAAWCTWASWSPTTPRPISSTGIRPAGKRHCRGPRAADRPHAEPHRSAAEEAPRVQAEGKDGAAWCSATRRRDACATWLRSRTAPGAVGPLFLRGRRRSLAEPGRRRPAEPPAGRVLVGPVTAAPLPAKSFDVVTMESYLEHEQSAGGLAYAWKILEAGGFWWRKHPITALGTAGCGAGPWCGFRFPDHCNYFTPHTLRAVWWPGRISSRCPARSWIGCPPPTVSISPPRSRERHLIYGILEELRVWDVYN